MKTYFGIIYLSSACIAVACFIYCISSVNMRSKSNANLNYDMALQSYFSPTEIHSENLSNYLNSKGFPRLSSDESIKIKQTLEVKLEYIETWPYSFLQQRRSLLSLKVQENNPILGLYCVNELNEYPPYTRLFRSNKENIGNFLTSIPHDLDDEIQTYGDLEVFLYTKLGVSIFELYDTLLSEDDISHLSRFESITHLGLPVRGMKFTQPFTFPSNLNFLIVRNTTLNDHFFKALNQLNQLENLILIDCLIDKNTIPAPEYNGFSMDGAATRDNGNLLYNGINDSLLTLKIIRSDPWIFEYASVYKWPVLTDIDVDIYDNYSAVTEILSKVLQGDEIALNFPKLKYLTVRANSGVIEIIEQWIDVIESSEKKIPFEFELYKIQQHPILKN